MTRTCPTCGALGAEPVRNVDAQRGEPDPGERAVYVCVDAHDTACPPWEAVVPEPPDDYKGDGIFAANH